MEELVGQKFNLLTVLSVHRRKYSPKTCLCRCDCGGTHTVRSDNLIHGRVKWCKNPIHRSKYTIEELKERKNKKERQRRAENKISTLSDEDWKLIRMRENLKTNKDIMQNTYYKKGQIQGLFRKYFKGKDPLHEHFASLIRNGRTLKSVCREFKVSTGMVSKICQSRGVVPPGSPSKRKYPKKNRDNKSFAEDCYCFFKDGMSVRDLSREVGYKQSTTILSLLKKYVPAYREMSEKRMEDTYKKQNIKTWWKRSGLYRFEKDFEKDCVDLIKERYLVIDNPPRFSFTPDVVLFINDAVVFIEMKVSARKVDLAKALGQTLVYSYQGHERYKNKRVFSLICVPDDLKYFDTFVLTAMGHNIITCKQSGLMKELEIIDKATQ